MVPDAQVQRWRDVRSDLAADIAAYASNARDYFGERPGPRRQLGILLTAAVLCCALHRLAHFLWTQGWRRSASLVALVNFVAHKARLSPAASIGGGLYIPHPAGIVFQGHAGRGLSLFASCLVTADAAHVHPPGCGNDWPTLGKNVTVGAHALILGPVRIGDEARVGPSAVVLHDVAPGATIRVNRRRRSPGSGSNGAPDGGGERGS